MNEKTIDTDNQPGLPKMPIRRSQIIAAVKELGIDPNRVMELRISADTVNVTAFVYDTTGAKSVLRWGEGFLKHEYSFPIVRDNALDDEQCTEGTARGFEEKP